MRKIVLLFLAVLFMTVPVMAVVSNVAITCVADGNKVTVSYASNLNRIRAFGLDIDVVGANITKVEVPADPCYRIFPGQIVIVDGNVIDYNTPYVPGDLGDANVTIEMGSLYTMDANYASDPNAGYNKRPGLSGTLLKFYVSGNCTYAVTKNAARGGIVMEDPNEDPNVGSPLCSGSVVTACFYVGLTDYCGHTVTQDDVDNWNTLGQPASWCESCHCKGDFNGDCNISFDDFLAMLDAWDTYNPDCDVDYNYAISFDDFLAVLAGWDDGCSGSCVPR